MNTGKDLPTSKGPRKRHAGMFGPGGRDPKAHIDPTKLAAARWSKDRRTLVAMAQEARPEAFATVLAIMRDPKVEPPTRLRAGELVLNYSDGKPRQSVDVSVGPREMSSLSRVELEAIARGAPPPFQLVHNGNVIEGEALQVRHAAHERERVPVGDRDESQAAQGESARG